MIRFSRLFYFGITCLALAIDIAAMPHFNNRYRYDLILDHIQDTVASLSNTVLFIATELFH